jgi:DNA-binding LacI/PurR family transcriptional regulator
MSKSLVSLVLRGSPKVSAASRQAVLEAVDALGYRPNRLAQGLVARRSGLVGVIASDLHNPFFTDLLDGVLESMETVGLQTLLSTGRRRPDAERELLASLVGLPVDGVLLLSPVVAAAELVRISRTTPTVVTGRPDIDADTLGTVVNDDAAGAHSVVEHLVALGHRHIAHITGGVGPAAAARSAGFRHAMAAAGLAGSMTVVPGDFTEEGGYQAMRRLLAAPARATAVFAANDYAALGALNAIDEAGLAVPGDVSLVGYDNSSIAAFRRISLTSVDQPRGEMGRLAADALKDRIRGSSGPARHIVLTPRLVPRASTAPPR